MVPHVAFVGGFGSGKTFSVCWKALLLSLVHQGLPGVIASPTFRMMKNTTLPTFREILADLGIFNHTQWRAQDLQFTMPWGSTVTFVSADDPMKLRGSNLAWALIDEATLVEKFTETFESLTSRLRHPKATRDKITNRPLFQFAVSCTPEGELDSVYDLFFRPPRDKTKTEKWKRDFQVVTSSSYDNPVMSSTYLENLEMNVPEALRKAHIEGVFVAINQGKAYYSFNESINLQNVEYDPTLDLRLMWDFNLSPMTLLVGQKRGTNVFIFDEIIMNNATTPDLCRQFIAKYGLGGYGHSRKIFIYGDATGGKGTAEWTDYETIREYLEMHFSTQAINLKIPHKNPPHKRRVQSVNAKLRNSRGETTLFINPRCHNLIRDLRYQRMDGARKDKRQEIQGQTIGHASDAMDYFIDFEFMYVRPNAHDRGAIPKELMN